jgi:hypothetical protein
MRSDVRALLRPLVRAVGMFLAVALGVVACLLNGAMVPLVLCGQYVCSPEQPLYSPRW